MKNFLLKFYVGYEIKIWIDKLFEWWRNWINFEKWSVVLNLNLKNFFLNKCQLKGIQKNLVGRRWKISSQFKILIGHKNKYEYNKFLKTWLK